MRKVIFFSFFTLFGASQVFASELPGVLQDLGVSKHNIFETVVLDRVYRYVTDSNALQRIIVRQVPGLLQKYCGSEFLIKAFLVL